jgi:hypothetical protein
MVTFVSLKGLCAPLFIPSRSPWSLAELNTWLLMQAPDVGLKPRTGGVEIKGKGHMRTFWVSAGNGGAAAVGSFDSIFGAAEPGGILPAGPQPVERLALCCDTLLQFCCQDCLALINHDLYR